MHPPPLDKPHDAHDPTLGSCQQADLDRTLAENNAKKADANVDETHKHVGEQYVAHGGRLMEMGDTSGAALLFAEALNQDRNDAERSAMHRIRLGTALRQCPYPFRVILQKDLIHDAHAVEVDLGRSGRGRQSAQT